MVIMDWHPIDYAKNDSKCMNFESSFYDQAKNIAPYPRDPIITKTGETFHFSISKKLAAAKKRVCIQPTPTKDSKKN